MDHEVSVQLHRDAAAAAKFLPNVLSLPFTPPSGADRDLARFLGVAATPTACAGLCSAYRNLAAASPVSAWFTCKAFAFFTPAYALNASYAGQCFGWLDAGGTSSVWRQIDWTTMVGVTSGAMPPAVSRCTNAMDCSLNGVCSSSSSGHCVCDAAWSGARCETLELRPTAVRSGLSLPNTSFWGGSVLASSSSSSSSSASASYTMFASEMLSHCGINAWRTNSHIVQATASAPEGPYTKTKTGGGGGGEVWPAFSHEPTVVRAPTGESVMFFLMSHNSSLPRLCTACTSGATPDGPCDNTTRPADPNTHDPTWMSFTKSLNSSGRSSSSGNRFHGWSKPVVVLQDPQPIDSNLAPVILDDGSLVGMIRTWPDGSVEGSTIALVTATNWRDPRTYTQEKDALFPADLIKAVGLEDPNLYLDENGDCHAMFHSMMGSPMGDPRHVDDQRACGAHAFAKKESCATSKGWRFGGEAYGNTVEYVDGTRRTFARRERPHVLTTHPRGGAVTHLTNGAVLGGERGDACETIIQPVRTTPPTPQCPTNRCGGKAVPPNNCIGAPPVYCTAHCFGGCQYCCEQQEVLMQQAV